METNMANTWSVMAQYLYATGGHTPTPWELKGLAVACFTFIVLGESKDEKHMH